MKIDNLKKRFIRFKGYYDRARQYSGVIQFSMSMATFVYVVAPPHILVVLNAHRTITLLAGLVIVVVGHLVIGRLEHKLGLHHEENRRNSEINPITMEILKLLREIREGQNGK